MAMYEFSIFDALSSTSTATDQVEGSSDMSFWVNNLIPELAPLPPQIGDTWDDQIGACVAAQQSQQPLTMESDLEEDKGIRLVHALLTCANAIQRGELLLAASQIDQMCNDLLTHVGTSRGIGKVAGCFVEALSRRLYGPAMDVCPVRQNPEHEVLYHSFYEACPYLKFAHFTANQAILEAFEGHDCVHVIDFSLMHGLQWPALIQALALRPGGPPSLRLTVIGPVQGNGYSIRDIGSRLALLARSMNVKFAFRALAAPQLQDVKPWVLEADPREAVAVNSIFQLHRLLGTGIESTLKWIMSLKPKIVTLVEQEADHNQVEFLARFTEALYYYSTMFDSLEDCHLLPEKALAELHIKMEIENIVCCEGMARVERHEPLAKWQTRMAQAGFKPLPLSHKAFRQASMLLTLFSSEGYSVQEREGCLTLGWHSRPLVSASAWRVDLLATDSRRIMVHEKSSSSSSSSEYIGFDST